MRRAFLMLLLLCPILVLALNTDPKAVIGKIDNKTYTFGEYKNILKNYLAYHEKQQGKPLSDADKARFNDQCWEELIGRTVYDKAIKAGKVRITEAELLTEAKKNPPAAVKQIPDLKTNGKFDKTKFENALNTSADFKKAVIEEVRAMYQYTKLLNKVRSEVSVVEDSVKQDWMAQNDFVDAKIIFFDPNKNTTVNASEEEALEYYNGHKEDYRKDDVRTYSYVRFAKAASVGDSLAVKARVDSLYLELLAGADFAKKAEELSQDPGSAKNGGDLGWCAKGRRVKVFEDTAFATPNGQIAPPVLSQFGWHIIKTEDRRSGESGEEVSARHILIRIDASAATLQALKTDSALLHQLAKANGLDNAALMLNKKLEETPPFQAKDSFIRNIGRDENLIKFAFANPSGTVADLFFAPSGDAFVLAVAQELPVYYTPFEEQKAQIQNQATKTKRGYFMDQYVQNFMKNLTPADYLSWAARDSIMVVEITGHKRGDNITSIGKVAAIEDSLFALAEGQFSGLITDTGRWFLVQVTKRTPPDMTLWDKDKKQLVQTAREEKQTKHLNDWYVAERKKLSLIDNRNDFYDLSAGRQTQQIRLGN